MKTEDGETILYINRYYEKNLTTGEVTTSYYLGGRLIAEREGSTLNYLHQDHLTGTSVASDSSGTLVSSINYFPFGSTRSGSVPTDKKFTGQRLDGTGLYYYGARYYDAEIGRFISADTIVPNPANPQSLNRYSYCLNNPLKYIDPSGHDAYMAMVQWYRGHGQDEPMPDELLHAYLAASGYYSGYGSGSNGDSGGSSGPAGDSSGGSGGSSGPAGDSSGGSGALRFGVAELSGSDIEQEGDSSPSLPIDKEVGEGNGHNIDSNKWGEVWNVIGNVFIGSILTVGGITVTEVGFGVAIGGTVASEGAAALICIPVGALTVAQGYGFIRAGIERISQGSIRLPDIPWLPDIIDTPFWP